MDTRSDAVALGSHGRSRDVAAVPLSSALVYISSCWGMRHGHAQTRILASKTSTHLGVYTLSNAYLRKELDSQTARP